MSDIAINCEGLGKRYRIGQRESYRALRDVIGDTLRAPFRKLRAQENGHHSRDKSQDDTFWALKDISFEVKHGEVLGIIGRNGAGKSTLLKILSRITKPTKGSVILHGRVGSLLEVGTGFHPELTGRENIYLNGTILGMKNREIERKFDEIVSFAETEQFLDTPVKRYSSGMYVRLAFAVAAHLEPEILIVDEVLAVGDAAFQKKCLGKMTEIAKQGRTVIFVSHNMAAVNTLCDKAMLLHEGKHLKSDTATEVVKFYLEGECVSPNQQVWSCIDEAPGSNKARVLAVRVLDSEGKLTTQAEINSTFFIEVEYQVLVVNTILNVTIILRDQQETLVLSSPSITDTDWFQRPHPIGVFCSRCSVPATFLNHGRYSVTVLLVENGTQILTQLDSIVSIEMVDLGTMRGGYLGSWGGVVRPSLEWKTQIL